MRKESATGPGDWFVILPRLTKNRGKAIVALARILGIERQAELVSREEMFQLSLDASSAQLLEAVLRGREGGPLQEDMLQAILEDLDGFLAVADRLSRPEG